jgi:ABC-type transport system substrate-binding protein
MDETKSFRRAFLAGLLTLGVALSGQMATSNFDAAQTCAFSSSASHRQLDPAIGLVQLEPRARPGLAERVARAVIGAVLHGFA